MLHPTKGGEHVVVADLLQASSATPLDVAMRRVSKLTSILDVAKAMTLKRNLNELLPLILKEAARVVEADRCTLFILDRERSELWSRIAQGATGEIRMPMNKGIAGAVATSGEVINLKDVYEDARFARNFDVTNNYRTKSILCVPMRDTRGDITGVIQALNASDGTFDAEDEELLLALGGQAAQAIENALLNEEINRLFEGFVQASVVAIESRDPSTAGHSGRVSDLTVTLAQALEHVVKGPYAGTRFNSSEIQEIRYASLLHDFGKVGVREPVLVKAEKLYPHEFDVLKQRFDLARKDRQLASCTSAASRLAEAARRPRLRGHRARRRSAPGARRAEGPRRGARLRRRVQPAHGVGARRLRAAHRLGRSAVPRRERQTANAAHSARNHGAFDSQRHALSGGTARNRIARHPHLSFSLANSVDTLVAPRA